MTWIRSREMENETTYRLGISLVDGRERKRNPSMQPVDVQCMRIYRGQGRLLLLNRPIITHTNRHVQDMADYAHARFVKQRMAFWMFTKNILVLILRRHAYSYALVYNVICDGVWVCTNRCGCAGVRMDAWTCVRCSMSTTAHTHSLNLPPPSPRRRRLTP